MSWWFVCYCKFQRELNGRNCGGDTRKCYNVAGCEYTRLDDIMQCSSKTHFFLSFAQCSSSTTSLCIAKFSSSSFLFKYSVFDNKRKRIFSFQFDSHCNVSRRSAFIQSSTFLQETQAADKDRMHQHHHRRYGTVNKSSHALTHFSSTASE